MRFSICPMACSRAIVRVRFLAASFGQAGICTIGVSLADLRQGLVLRHLHRAGYNILTCDLRHCGMSGEANGNPAGLDCLDADTAGLTDHLFGTSAMLGYSPFVLSNGQNRTFGPIGPGTPDIVFAKSRTIVSGVFRPRL